MRRFWFESSQEGRCDVFLEIDNVCDYWSRNHDVSSESYEVEGLRNTNLERNFGYVPEVGMEREDQSRQSLDNHVKIGEIRRFCNRKFESSHDVHRPPMKAKDYSKPCKRGEYQYV